MRLGTAFRWMPPRVIVGRHLGSSQNATAVIGSRDQPHDAAAEVTNLQRSGNCDHCAHEPLDVFSVCDPNAGDHRQGDTSHRDEDKHFEPERENGPDQKARYQKNDHGDPLCRRRFKSVNRLIVDVPPSVFKRPSMEHLREMCGSRYLVNRTAIPSDHYSTFWATVFAMEQRFNKWGIA